MCSVSGEKGLIIMKFKSEKARKRSFHYDVLRNIYVAKGREDCCKFADRLVSLGIISHKEACSMIADIWKAEELGKVKEEQDRFFRILNI